jgi:hypothetical protein
MSSASRRPPPRPAAAPPGPPRPRAGRQLRTLRALAVLVLFVIGFVLWQAASTRGWRPAQAAVGEVETQIGPWLDLRRFGIHLGRQRRESFTYSYQVGPVTYQGREDGTPAGSRLVVYYDPANPGRSQVGRPRLGPALGASAAAVALLALGFWLARRLRFST